MINVTVLSYVWTWHAACQDVWLLCNTPSKGLFFCFVFLLIFVRRIIVVCLPPHNKKYQYEYY